MSGTLIDSNVLLDVLTEDERWFSWSSEALAEAANTSRPIVNPIIFAEVSVRFSRVEELEAALPASMFEREPLPFAAAFLAGKAFLEYRRRGGVKIHPLPDFYIGAHAVTAGHRLLTRDAQRYRTYFAGLEIVAPE
jgi:predicted nucleic acid-binding protein